MTNEMVKNKAKEVFFYINNSFSLSDAELLKSAILKAIKSKQRVRDIKLLPISVEIQQKIDEATANDFDSNIFGSFLYFDWVVAERLAIGSRIKQLREDAGLTQDQLAEKTGLLKQNIGRIELGKYSTGQDILSKIAAALGKKLDIV